jgi:hypothetical protein
LDRRTDAAFQVKLPFILLFSQKYRCVIPAKAGIHLAFQIQHGFPLSRE